MSYNGFKIVCGDQFPTYRSNYGEAYCIGMTYAMSTGKEAKIYGLSRIGQHLIKTCRKNPPRT